MIELPHGFILDTMPVPHGFTMAGFAESQRESMGDWWRSKGSVPFLVWLDATAPWGERRVISIGATELADNSTAIVSAMIRTMIEKSRVRAVLITSETWMVHHEAKEGVRSQYPTSLADAPGRREALMQVLEERGKPAEHWFAEIHRNPDRLDPWALRPFEGSEGRLGKSWFKEGGG